MTELLEMMTEITRTQAEEYIDLQNKIEYARQVSAELEQEYERDLIAEREHEQ